MDEICSGAAFQSSLKLPTPSVNDLCEERWISIALVSSSFQKAFGDGWVMRRAAYCKEMVVTVNAPAQL
jgi:hypothetical protein